jgi:chorismate-pyruvate lyase
MTPATAPQTLDHPDITRMLLYSDGSTTVLLEALVRRRLVAVVDRQGLVDPAGVPDSVYDKLCPDGARVPLVQRNTRLVTADQDVLSTNRVFLLAADSADLLPSKDVPLGRFLASQRLSAWRDHVSFTVRQWPHGPGRPSVGKDYVIHCRSGARIYVSEQFNPDFIPTSEAS